MKRTVQIGPGVLCKLDVHDELASTLTAFLPQLPMPYHFEHRKPVEIEVSTGPAPRVTDRTSIVARGEGFEFRYSPELRTGAAWLNGELPSYQRATPLRQLFSWAIDGEGGALLHAAAVVDDQAVILAGPSGSGKSTLAAACYAEDQLFLGDDWVPVYADGPGRWFVGGLYSSLKISSKMSARFELERCETSITHKTKKVLMVSAHPTFFRVGAVVVPYVGAQGSGVSLKTIAPFDALKAIAPSTLLQSSGVSPHVLTRIKELVESVPCYELGVDERSLKLAPQLISALTKRNDDE